MNQYNRREVIWLLVCGLPLLALQTGCGLLGLRAPQRVAWNANDHETRGATLLLHDRAKAASAALAAIPISCPTDPKYRLPGFSMKCTECHYRHIAGELFETTETQKKEACEANLKYVGLAARTWAAKHHGVLPSNFPTFACELRSPYMATCPAQTNKHPANPWEVYAPKPKTWADLDSKNAAYRIVSPARRHREPKSDYVRCLIHGHVLRADGTVAVPAQE